MTQIPIQRGKDIVKVLLTGVVAMMFSSCIATGYIPQHAQAPLLEQRGEVQLTAGLSTGGMLDATLSAGLTDHLATQMHLGGQPLQNLPGTYSMALGYYRHLGPVVAEAWLGVEQGSVCNRSALPMVVEWFRYTSGEYNLPFVQLDCGLRDLTPLHIDCGVALRGGIMKPQLITATWNDLDGESAHSSYGAGTPLLEPQLFVRMGWGSVKYSLQTGWCFPSTGNNGKLYYKSFSLMMGATFILGNNKE